MIEKICYYDSFANRYVLENLEEASVKINSSNAVEALTSAIVCTKTEDPYNKGFRNGLRYAIAILTDSDPEYE